MKQFMQKLGDKIRTFMYGRYGFDELSMFLSVFALVLAFASSFFPPISFLALITLFFSIYRTYSRKLEKRRRERDAYLNFVGKIKRGFSLRRDMWRDRKTHRYYKCPVCKAHLRVPKGKGEITITCPVCHNKFDKKT